MAHKISLITLLIFLTAAPGPAFDSGQRERPETFPHGVAVRVISFENKRIRESSGLAPSRLSGEVLWTVNDSGHGPELFAAGLNGEDLGTFRVPGARNQDWEDLASFRWEGRSYLLAADTGDNRAGRKSYTLYVVGERAVDPGRVPDHGEMPVAWKIVFRYEDGSHNCEAVAVDPVREKILLITKDDAPPRVYALPLRPKGGGRPLVAEYLGEVPHLPQPSGKNLSSMHGPYGSRPTALDLSPDGSRALVLTYRHACIFEMGHRGGWKKGFNGRPLVLRIPKLHQAEGACFSHDGRSLFVSSEKRFPFSLPGF